MKLKLVIPAIVLSLATAVPACASGIVLPDSCGKDDVKFDVEKHKGSAPPPPPADGKAQIVFIATMHVPMLGKGPVTRFGVDGTWVGASLFNTYFTVDVEPGEHHLCSALQGSFGMSKNVQKDMIGMDTFTAEAGKIYYYDFKITMTGGTSDVAIYSAGFTKLNEDEGKFQMKSSDFSTSKPKK